MFEDGSEIHDIDLVVLATGFDFELDILDVPGLKGTQIKMALKAMKSIFAHLSIHFISCSLRNFHFQA